MLLYRIIDSAGAIIDWAPACADAESATASAAALWARGIEAHWQAAPAAVYALPPRFYFDHCERDLPAGIIERETRRAVFVRLDALAHADILSDARFYCDSATAADMRYCDAGIIGLQSSARATVRRLVAAPAPQSS